MQSFGTQLSILLRNEAHVKPFYGSAESSNTYTGKPSLLSFRKTLWFFFIDGPQLFTTQSSRVSGTHLINLGKMKDWLDLRATLWFWTLDPGLEVWHLKGCRSRVYSCNFIKYDSTTEIFLHVFCMVALLKFSGKFL